MRQCPHREYQGLTFTCRSLCLLLALAGDDLDSLSLDIVRVIQLELDVLDNEGPDLVAEAVGVEMSLQQNISACSSYYLPTQSSYLECHPGLHLVP